MRLAVQTRLQSKSLAGVKPLSDSLTVPSAPSCPALAESAMIVIISHPALCLGMTAGQHVGTCLGAGPKLHCVTVRLRFCDVETPYNESCVKARKQALWKRLAVALCACQVGGARIQRLLLNHVCNSVPVHVIDTRLGFSHLVSALAC